MGNESMIFLGIQFRSAEGVVLCASSGGKIHYIIVYGVLLLFLHFPKRFGKNGFDCCEQQHGESEGERETLTGGGRGREI